MKKNILGLAVVAAIAVIATVLTVNLTGGSSNHDTVSLAALAPVDDGADQGIKVRGQWTIEIREPDGKFVSRQEFENALTFNGAWRLARLLGRSVSGGVWVIVLTDDVPLINKNAPCDDGVGNVSLCRILEVSVPTNGFANSFATLTVQVPSSGLNEDQLVLSGHFTASRDGVINLVETWHSSCDASVAPADCPEAPLGQVDRIKFTSADITDVAIQNGQQVLVTVVISFS